MQPAWLLLLRRAGSQVLVVQGGSGRLYLLGGGRRRVSRLRQALQVHSRKAQGMEVRAKHKM